MNRNAGTYVPTCKLESFTCPEMNMYIGASYGLDELLVVQFCFVED